MILSFSAPSRTGMFENLGFMKLGILQTDKYSSLACFSLIEIIMLSNAVWFYLFWKTQGNVVNHDSISSVWHAGSDSTIYIMPLLQIWKIQNSKPYNLSRSKLRALNKMFIHQIPLPREWSLPSVYVSHFCPHTASQIKVSNHVIIPVTFLQEVGGNFVYMFTMVALLTLWSKFLIT